MSANINEVQRLRETLGISRAEFGRRYHIPVRTLEDWEWGKRTPPEYVIELLTRAVASDMMDEAGELIARIEAIQKTTEK